MKTKILRQFTGKSERSGTRDHMYIPMYVTRREIISSVTHREVRSSATGHNVISDATRRKTVCDAT
jgi:hypothetical protein